MSELWQIRWHWSGQHAAVDEPNIMVLPQDTNAETVRWYVEKLYMEKALEWDERISFTLNPPPPYPASVEPMADGRDSVICGHNPWIEARLVPVGEIQRETG